MLYLKVWNINRHLCSPPNVHIPYYMHCGNVYPWFFLSSKKYIPLLVWITFLGVICIPICTSTLYLDIKSIRQTSALFVLCMYSKSTERHTVQLCVVEPSVYHTVPETANTYLKYRYVVKLFFVNYWRFFGMQQYPGYVSICETLGRKIRR